MGAFSPDRPQNLQCVSLSTNVLPAACLIRISSVPRPARAGLACLLCVRFHSISPGLVLGNARICTCPCWSLWVDGDCRNREAWIIHAGE